MTQPTFQYRGLIVPVFTPFHEDRETINVSVIPHYATFLAENGIQGILVNGTTGEGPSLTVEERILTTELWAKAAKENKLHLMVQVGGAALPDVLKLAKHAEKIGVDSILCLPDLFFKPLSSEELIRYLKIVGSAAPKTPLLYYHVPMFTGVNIHMGQCMRSTDNELPSFVGIKFTSNNLEECSQALHANNNQYVVFLGNDLLITAGCALGLNSFITTSANIFPRLVLDTIKTASEGNIQLAKKMQNELTHIVTEITSYGKWVPTMKAAMSSMTPIKVGSPREPLEQLPIKTTKLLETKLRRLINEG